MKNILRVFAFFFLSLLCIYAGCKNEQGKKGKKTIILATTTSVQDTGLLDKMISAFENSNGYIVKPVAVGSGQAISLGKRGEADVLFVHSPEDEEEFMKEGFGVSRKLVMSNYFMVAGPLEDPARAKGAGTILKVFQKIFEKKAIFVSRGDKSGTDVVEKKLWKMSGINPEGNKWYIETGAGMGQTLSIASEKGAYTLTDNATFMKLKKSLKLQTIEEENGKIKNEYHVIRVNPVKFKWINAEGGKILFDFITSRKVCDIIKNFGMKEYGVSLFQPGCSLDNNGKVN